MERLMANRQNQRGSSLRLQCPLQKRKILKYGLRSACKALLALAIVSGALVWRWSMQTPDLPIESVFYNHLGYLSGIGLLFMVIAFAHPILYFMTYFYDMDDKNMLICKGIFARREIILPFSRITDINVEQDWLDVIFSLYRIHISTPTSESGKFAHIDGINRKSSIQIRTMLLQRINSTDYEPQQTVALRKVNQ